MLSIITATQTSLVTNPNSNAIDLYWESRQQEGARGLGTKRKSHKGLIPLPVATPSTAEENHEKNCNSDRANIYIRNELWLYLLANRIKYVFL